MKLTTSTHTHTHKKTPESGLIKIFKTKVVCFKDMLSSCSKGGFKKTETKV